MSERFNQVPSNICISDTIELIAEWHHNRNLIEGSQDKDQFLKLIEEIGELAGNLARGRPIEDDIGDAMVVLINIAERNGLSIKKCLDHAWGDIKDRKGRMENGVFIKECDE